MESGSGGGGGGGVLLADLPVGLPSEETAPSLREPLIAATGLTNVKNSGGWGPAEGGGAERRKR